MSVRGCTQSACVSPTPVYSRRQHRCWFACRNQNCNFSPHWNHLPSQDENAAAEGEDRQGAQGVQPIEDSLSILWDVVSALHDSGWHEDDLPRAILRLWKASTIEPRLSNLSSLSLPEDFVATDTIPVELTSMGPCEVASCPGVNVGTTRYEG